MAGGQDALVEREARISQQQDRIAGPDAWPTQPIRPGIAAHECETRHVRLPTGDSFQHWPEIALRLPQLLQLPHRGVIGLSCADLFIRSSVALALRREVLLVTPFCVLHERMVPVRRAHSRRSLSTGHLRRQSEPDTD